MSWRSDSTGFLFLDGVTPAGGLSLLSVEDNGSLEPVLHTQRAVESNADVSPDGQWLAYNSDESGRREVYVRPFPEVNGSRRQISQGGGTRPVWARDGRELLYLDSGGRGKRIRRSSSRGSMPIRAPSGTTTSPPRGSV